MKKTEALVPRRATPPGHAGMGPQVLANINTFWIPSYNEVIGRPQGTVQEALVVARIWSSAPGEAQAALNAAGAEADRTKRIKIELRDYGNRSRTNDRRAKHVMPRPVIAYDLSARP